MDDAIVGGSGNRCNALVSQSQTMGKDSSSHMTQNEELYISNSKFESYDELLKSARDFYYAKGYAVSIRDSKKDKYVTLQCDRSGSYRDRLCIRDKRKKNTGSRLIKCPFQIVGKKGNDGAWVLKAKNLTHNHEPSTDISGHPSFRRLSSDDVQSVKNMTLSGIPPRKILSSLRQSNHNIQVLHKCNVPVFRELLYHVSHFALKEIHIQYEKIKNGTMTPCTGHFMTTMGLPCSHKIKHLQGTTLSLDLIHPHWRIDTLCLNLEEDSHNDCANEFDGLLSELSSKYQMWPLSKKEFATSMITKLLTESDTFFEPIIRRPKGRPPKSKKKKGINSTTREPSRFEFVESSRTHNPSSSTCLSQMNNEVAENISYISHESNLFDLNAYPTFSSDDISFE